MATTRIHSITSTPAKALNYVMQDKIENYIGDEFINKDIPHIVIDEENRKIVKYFTLTTFQNCNPNKPFSTYEDIKNKWQGKKYKGGGKTKNGKEVLMWHMHQSFKGFEVTPEIANEIGRKLAERVFKGFTVTISTHGNTNNIHNHFIISAWNNEGKKWNNCNSNYRLIRKISDELCKEYGLHVLEETKNMNLVKYKDMEGNNRYYEPTTRKNNLIEKRKNNSISSDDINSYRNTSIYLEKENIKLSNRKVIMNDIDNLIKISSSYDELVFRLRDIGYDVKDKKKNGEYLKYVSYKAPLQERATREDKLDEFYLRRNLIRYFEKQQLEMNTRCKHNYDETIPYYHEYKDLSQINYSYKTIKDNSTGELITVERNESEKRIIDSIKLDTDRINKDSRNNNNNKTLDFYIDQIKNSYRCLKYTEEHNIYNYEQVIDMYKACKDKYNAAMINFDKSYKVIEQLKNILKLPNRIKELELKLSNANKGIEYTLEEFSRDAELLKKYKVLIDKYKIASPEGIEELKSKVESFEERFKSSSNFISEISMQMKELENVFNTYDRIDNKIGKRDYDALSKFKNVVDSNKVDRRDIERERGNEYEK